MYYINKFGIESHLKKTNNDTNPTKYFLSLYGKILFVLNINPNNTEFNEYKKSVRRLLEYDK